MHMCTVWVHMGSVKLPLYIRFGRKLSMGIMEATCNEIMLNNGLEAY